MPNAEEVRSIVRDALERGCVEDALLWRAELARSIDEPRSLSLLGRLVAATGDIGGGLAFLGEALRLEPYLADTLLHRGRLLSSIGEHHAAISLFERALLFTPFDEELLDALCASAAVVESDDVALRVLERRAKLNPASPTVWRRLGAVSQRLRDFSSSESAYRRAIALDAGDRAAHQGLGTALLHLGRTREGFREALWSNVESEVVVRLERETVRWNGEPLGDRRLLIVANGSERETIDGFRYVAMLAKNGAKLAIWAPLRSAGLFRRAGATHAVSANRDVLPPCDLYAPITHLPYLVDAERIPIEPYLRSSDERREEAKATLGPRREALRLGLLWRESEELEHAQRGVALAQLAPLLDAPGIRFVSLQQGAARTEIRTVPIRIEDRGEHLESLDATAALLAALDGIVAVDSAALALAGSLGVRGVALLSRDADWRWGEDETPSPWYPTLMSLQQRRHEPIEALAERAARLLPTWLGAAPRERAQIISGESRPHSVVRR